MKLNQQTYPNGQLNNSIQLDPLNIRCPTSSPIHTQYKIEPESEYQERQSNSSSGNSSRLDMEDEYDPNVNNITPIKFDKQIKRLSSPPKSQMSLLTYSTPNILQGYSQIKKPRINFHSIDDIVNGGNDSGIYNTSYFQYSSNSSNCSSSIIVQNSSLDHEDQKNLFTINHKYNDINSINDSRDIENEVKIKFYSSNNHPNESKKVRTTFTDEQKRELDIYFQKNPYPDPRETEELSEQLALPENVIKVWFQNKRSRDKQRKFSHSNRMINKNLLASLVSGDSGKAKNQAIGSASFSANKALQLFHSKLNTYAVIAAAAAAANSSNYYSTQLENSDNNILY